eukprot:2290130-Pyramimonas_sp.AAC.1
MQSNAWQRKAMRSKAKRAATRWRAATRRRRRRHGGQSGPQAQATGGDEAATAATCRPERPAGS